MSQKELAFSMLQNIPEFYMSKVVSYLQGLLDAQEAEDEAYCAALVDEYEASPDKGQFVTEEEFLKELSIAL